ncbi:MAG: hypothetical protein Q9194_007579, partial [Teloschistes cf. exilis]
MVSTTASESDNSLLAYGMSVSGTWDIGYSLCSDGEQFDCGRLENLPSHEQMEAVRDWNIGGYKIDSCLSSQRSTENLCSVEYSFQMMSNPEDGPLLTVGDAICSFLKVPDTSTRGLGIVTKRQISEDDRIWRAQEPRSGLAILITGSIFLGSGIAGLENRKSPVDLKSLVKMGFGAVQPRAFVGLLTPS